MSRLQDAENLGVITGLMEMSADEMKKVSECDPSFFMPQKANASRYTRDRAARRKATAKSVGYDLLTDREIGKMKNHSAVSHYVGKEPYNRHKVERFAEGNEPFNPYAGDTGFRCGNHADTFRIEDVTYTKVGEFFLKSARRTEGKEWQRETYFATISESEYEEAKQLFHIRSRVVEPGAIVSVNGNRYVVYGFDGNTINARSIFGTKIVLNVKDNFNLIP